MTMMSDSNASEDLRELYATGLRNAHAVEKEAIQLIERQLERLNNYPEMSQRLRQHLDETQRQHERLDRILEGMDESRSVLKDWALQMMGNMGAVAHTPADDEILKNTFANLAFENYEIAAYKSLITMARKVGDQKAIPLLQESLQEEIEMARWIDAHVEDVTEQHMRLRASGQKADR